jgi:hypothetical protein
MDQFSVLSEVSKCPKTAFSRYTEHLLELFGLDA